MDEQLRAAAPQESKMKTFNATCQTKKKNAGILKKEAEVCVLQTENTANQVSRQKDRLMDTQQTLLKVDPQKEMEREGERKSSKTKNAVEQRAERESG